MKSKIFILLVVLVTIQLNAQCDFDPDVDGDLIFCPNQIEGELLCNIQNADSYQWFTRPFSGGPEIPIGGATNYFLYITNNDILNYISVDVAIDGCTERSPEVLIDQWIFLLPAVESTGDYIYDGGYFLICQGESMFMTLLDPYNTNITWYRDGTPIPNENNSTLEVSEPGSYTVSGAPSVCPDFIQFLGVNLDVIYNTDPNVCDIMGVDEYESLNSVIIYPNPANDMINIVTQGFIDSAIVTNSLGQELYNSNVDALETFIDISSYAKGTYFLKVQTEDNSITKKFIKE